MMLPVMALAQSTSQYVIVTMDKGGTIFKTNAMPVSTISVEAINVYTNWGWEDLRFPVTVLAPVTPNADVVANSANNSITFETTAGTNRVTDDHVYGVAQMPHTWRIYSDIRPHIHFEQTNADQTNCWYMYYRVQPLGGAITNTWSTLGPASNLFSYTSGTLHQLSIFGNIVMTNAMESSIVDFKVFRNGAAGTGDIEMKEVDFHYQIEKPTGEVF